MSFELTLYDALLSIAVSADKARAVIDALEHDMGSTLATKQDIRLLEQKLEQKIELLQSSMTIRLGSILVVAMGLLFAALKLT
jgi:ABC-type sulfate transport system substrate-binding protein